ncbi:hypothetical protein D3C78_1926520 [compost metagenome]
MSKHQKIKTSTEAETTLPAFEKTFIDTVINAKNETNIESAAIEFPLISLTSL